MCLIIHDVANAALCHKQEDCLKNTLAVGLVKVRLSGDADNRTASHADGSVSQVFQKAHSFA